MANLSRSCCAVAAIVSAIATMESGAQSIVVAPPIVVFSAFAGGANPPTQRVAVASSGTGALAWTMKGVQQSWLTVTPRKGAAPDSVSFAANIAGMRAGSYVDTVRIAPNDAATPTQLIPVVLVLRSAATFGAPSSVRLTTYEVELAFTGYSGLVEGAPNCKVNLRGYDRLVGTVSGVETTESDDDVVYYGTLRRSTAMDFCETKINKGPDQRGWCTVTLTGWAVADVELTVHSDSASGAYLKAAHVAAPQKDSVSGDCDPPETQQILADYQSADDGGGASPNGQPIDDTKALDTNNRRITFVAGGVPRLRVGTFPPDSPKGGWTLRVIRKIP